MLPYSPLEAVSKTSRAGVTGRETSSLTECLPQCEIANASIFLAYHRCREVSICTTVT
jgi:hypothetical protein